MQRIFGPSLAPGAIIKNFKNVHYRDDHKGNDRSPDAMEHQGVADTNARKHNSPIVSQHRKGPDLLRKR